MPAICKLALRAVLSLAITALAITAFAQATSGPPAGVSAGGAPKTVKISPDTAVAEVGQQLKLTATAFDAEGKAMEPKAMFWVALPGDLAAADNTGMVTFFAPGAVEVIAIVAGKPATAKKAAPSTNARRVIFILLRAPRSRPS